MLILTFILANMNKVKLLLFLSLLLLGCSTKNDNEKLFNAIKNQQNNTFKEILQAGNVDLEPPRQEFRVNRPLAYAAAYGTLDMVKLLVEQGADLDGATAYGDVPMMEVLERGNDPEIVKYLIVQGADVNKPNDFGISSFLGFCGGDDLDLVKLALEHGGKINQRYVGKTTSSAGQKNYSALQAAVAYDKPEIVKLLLDHGGDPYLEVSQGMNSFDMAKAKQHNDVLKILESHSLQSSNNN